MGYRAMLAYHQVGILECGGRCVPTCKTINSPPGKKGRIGPNELKGGSRRRKGSAVRARIAKRGVDELGISMAEIVRHVGVTTSRIAKAVARLEEEELW